MSANGHGSHKTVDTIAEETRALIGATADAADHKIVQARNRLSAALDAAKDNYVAVQKKAVASAKATDKAIRNNPYKSLGIAFGVGALVGFLISRRSKE